MSAVGLEGLEHTVQLTHTWINELDASEARVDESFRQDPLPNTAQAVMTVFGLLTRITPGAIADVRHALKISGPSGRSTILLQAPCAGEAE